MWNGKEILDVGDFRYATAKPGDYVTQAVVDDAMDCVPPASMSVRCSQMGGTILHKTRREDRQVAEHICYFPKSCWRVA